MRNRKKKNKYMLILVIVLAISIGYAAVSTTLKFSGTATVMKQSWDVHWSNPVVVEGSVNPSSVPVISEDQGDPNNTKLTWTANLKVPGEYYEFTVDTANSGTVDVMISNITSSISPALPDYIDFDIAYEDGQPIEINHKLAKATKNGNTIIPTTEKLRVRVYYDPVKATLDTLNAIPQEGVSYTFTYNITYSKASNSAVPREQAKMYYAFHVTGCDVDDYFDDPEYIERYQYDSYYDTLPLEFATSNTGATSNYVGGPTTNYKKLYIEYKQYRCDYGGYYSYFKSIEEAEYSSCYDPEYDKTIGYAPKMFYGYKINSNRTVLKNYLCIQYNNRVICEDREANRPFKKDDFISFFGEYNSSTGRGCRKTENTWADGFECISSDGKMRVTVSNEYYCSIYDRENHIIYNYEEGFITGPNDYENED